MVIPVVILGGFYLGAFTATEAGAIVAFYSLIAAALLLSQCHLDAGAAHRLRQPAC